MEFQLTIYLGAMKKQKSPSSMTMGFALGLLNVCRTFPILLLSVFVISSLDFKLVKKLEQFQQLSVIQMPNHLND